MKHVSWGDKGDMVKFLWGTREQSHKYQGTMKHVRYHWWGNKGDMVKFLREQGNKVINIGEQ
jgi:hypothetical protein